MTRRLRSAASFTSSAPDAWTLPRPHTDASQRRHTYGPVRSMDYEDEGVSTRLRVAMWCVGLVLVAILGLELFS